MYSFGAFYSSDLVLFYYVRLVDPQIWIQDFIHAGEFQLAN